MGFVDFLKGKKKQENTGPSLPDINTGVPEPPSSSQPAAPGGMPSSVPESMDAPPMPPPELAEVDSQSVPSMPAEQPMSAEQSMMPSMPQDPQADVSQDMQSPTEMPSMQDSTGSLPDLPDFESIQSSDTLDLGELPSFPEVEQSAPATPNASDLDPQSNSAQTTSAPQSDDVPESGIIEDMPSTDDTTGLPDFSDEDLEEQEAEVDDSRLQDIQTAEMDAARDDLMHFRAHDTVKGPVFVDVDKFRVIMHHVRYIGDDIEECDAYHDQIGNLMTVMDESYENLRDSFMQMHRKFMLMDKILFER
ncbi:MAG: hypothetical protein ACOCWQ_00215 [Nanoarchaeota archaeon]